MLGIYTRLSKEDDASNSIENQIREGEEFAKNLKKKQNLKHKIYNEGEGLSGGLSHEHRPQLAEMVADIKSGLLKVIWMRNQNRLERNSMLFHFFVDIVRKNNIDVYFGDGAKVDYQDPNSVLQGSLLSSFNTYLRELQGFQTKKSLKRNIKEGKVHGVIPYGFKKDSDGKLARDKKEVETVKLIFKLSLEGNGYNKIAKELNESGVPTRYNKIGKGTYKHVHKKSKAVEVRSKSNTTWSAGSIQGIIKNKIYYGVREFGGEIYELDNPIFEKYYFDKVHRNLKVNNKTGTKKRKHDYLLNDVNVCGVCGKGYNGRVVAVNDSYHYYRCVTKRNGKHHCGNTSVRLQVVEPLLWKIYFQDKFMLNLMNLGYNLDDSINEIEPMVEELKTLSEQKDSLLAEQKNVVELTLNGTFKKHQVQSKMDEIDNGLNATNERIDEVMTEFKEQQETLESIVDASQVFDDIDNVESFEDKKELIEKYISKISITRKPNEHAILHVDFKAPNIESDAIVIDENYNWYCEPARNHVVPYNGFKIDKKKDVEILKEVHEMFGV